MLLKICDFCNYNQLHFLFIATLEDSHILKLSQYITSEQDLRELGTNALGVRERTIDTALTNYRTSINDAAYNILSTWRKQYESSEKAFMDLQAGLRRAEKKELAALLRKWAGEQDDPNERKLLKLCPTCNEQTYSQKCVRSALPLELESLENGKVFSSQGKVRKF